MICRIKPPWYAGDGDHIGQILGSKVNCSNTHLKLWQLLKKKASCGCDGSRMNTRSCTTTMSMISSNRHVVTYIGLRLGKEFKCNVLHMSCGTHVELEQYLCKMTVDEKWGGKGRKELQYSMFMFNVIVKWL